MQELMIKLNDLYTELEYEEEKETIKKIKKEIKIIELKLEEEK